MEYIILFNHQIPSGGLYGDKKSCQPYHFPECDDHPHKCVDYKDTPKCSQKCQPGFNKTLEEDKTYGNQTYYISGEEDIMTEIYLNGPVAAAYDYYEDFSSYKSGIYQHVYGKKEGGHGVKIIGWGEENGVKYWIIANSWNPRWGESGFFRMLRGTNECDIESSCSAGTPKL